MKLRLEFSNSIYDCQMIVKDAYGKYEQYFALAQKTDDAPLTAEIEVDDGEVDLSLLPIAVNYGELLDDSEQQTWKDKLINKVVGKGLDLLLKSLLVVGCTYHISGVVDGDVLFVNCGWYGHESQLDMIPIAYMYYEVDGFGKTHIPTAAWGINRDEVIKGARKLALLDFGPELIFTYPIGVSRVKRLTKDKRVLKTLQKFYSLPEAKRQAIRAKMKR